MIKRYKFGEITIDNSIFDDDVIITPDRVIKHWKRKNHHLLTKQDCNNIISFDYIEHVVIGTGTRETMKVDKELIEFFDKEGITYTILPTPKAAGFFNKVENNNKMGMFHIFC